ncbi:hypothetical protein BDQ12DRAFT_467703 [Crucibulum laeve]|uniref:G-protein coupled receptors family 1 profile domain-containing protein n=1 Tax=Crucibulum laeve TaxID=68775 RepID=A0A5C3M5X2_9AGAR|nr:hypothetical protein BDQ12DRAFT_467703 [Crucibulum laeve]
MAPIFAAGQIFARATQKELGSSAPVLLNLWTGFNLITNTILLPILVMTFLFSGRAKRHPTLVNLCITWIFSGIFSLLLFFAGQQRGPEPNQSVCIAQTSLLYGITPMWSVAVLMMMYYITLALNGDPGKAILSKWQLVLMLSAPYIAQCSFTIATLFVSIDHPDKVNRAHRYFYCALRSLPIFWSVTIFTAVFCLFIFILEVHLSMKVYRIWRGRRNAGRSSGLDIQLVLRVLAFGLYITFGMVVNVISMLNYDSVLPDMYAATVGTVVFLVFGTQSDVLRVWAFWLPEKKRRPPTIFITRENNWSDVLDLAKSAPADITEKGFDMPPVPPPKVPFVLPPKAVDGVRLKDGRL